MDFAIALPQGPEVIILVIVLIAVLIAAAGLYLVRRLGVFRPDAPPPPIEPASDRISQLERLDKLRQDGALTEEEFQREKAKLN